MRKVVLSLLALIMALAMVMVSMVPASAAWRPWMPEEDPFVYSPSSASVTVSPGESTDVDVEIGIDSGGLVLTYPVTATEWNFGGSAAAWVTANPAPPYTWAVLGSTVTVTLTIAVPDGATGTYSLVAKLKPGKDISCKPKTVGSGTGIHVRITVKETPSPRPRFYVPFHRGCYSPPITPLPLRWLNRCGY